jgi:ribosomal protein L16/L10AE
MLQPKRTKYRKAFKGRIRGAAKGGFNLDFGAFGLKAMEPDRLMSSSLPFAQVPIAAWSMRKPATSLTGTTVCTSGGTVTIGSMVERS